MWYDDEKLVSIVTKVREKCATLLAISIGERSVETYQKLYNAGARAALLRFETGNPDLYKKIRPDHKLEDRIDLIKRLADMGYLIMTGFLVGLPGQTEKDILNSIEFTGSLGTDMFSMGPFLPHPGTPLSDAPSSSIDLMLDTIARSRLLFPESKILATTALETLDNRNGAKRGLMAGANSLMINVTPTKYHRKYELYPNRAGTEADIKKSIDSVLELLYSLGRAPTDIGM